MSHYKLLLEVDTTIRDGKVTDLIVPIDSPEQNCALINDVRPRLKKDKRPFDTVRMI